MTDRNHFNLHYSICTTGKPHTSVLDLDAMGYADLDTASDHPALHLDVRAYAGMRAEAMSSRGVGQLNRANRIERKLRRMYLAIPERLRWTP